MKRRKGQVIFSGLLPIHFSTEDFRSTGVWSLCPHSGLCSASSAHGPCMAGGRHIPPALHFLFKITGQRNQVQGLYED